MLHDPKTAIGSDFDHETAEKIAPQFIARLDLANCTCVTWNFVCDFCIITFFFFQMCICVVLYLYFCSEPVQSRHGTIVVALKDEWVRHSLAQVTTCFSFHCIIFAYFVFVFLSELVLRVPHSFDQTTTCFFFNSIKPGTTFSLSILKKA